MYSDFLTTEESEVDFKIISTVNEILTSEKEISNSRDHLCLSGNINLLTKITTVIL